MKKITAQTSKIFSSPYSVYAEEVSFFDWLLSDPPAGGELSNHQPRTFDPERSRRGE